MPDRDPSIPRRWSRAASPIVALALAACGAGPYQGAGPGARPNALGAAEGQLARIDVRRLEARPRLTLVSRDGDPAPAVAAVALTGLGSATTTALAAVMEARLRAAGFEPDVRVDRDAFRVRLLLPDAARASAVFTALASAAARPIVAGSPEIALATQRLTSLKRNPLDAPELAAVAACTGSLGIAPGEAVPDLTTPAAVRDLEAARAAVLNAERMSLSAVGPAAFTNAVALALERSSGWPAAGAAVDDAVPAADATGVYVAPSLDRRAARLSVAVRVPDPTVAAAAAERLGAPDSALVTRLRALPEPWRVAQIAGVARARGGCVSVVLEIAQHASGQPLEPSAAVAAALARREMTAEIGANPGSQVTARQIVAAADPREAASRAAWWALATPAPAAPLRWATALGTPPADRMPRDAAAPPGAGRFQTEVDRALAAIAGAERRLAVERGQGELWVLLASPCGVAEEAASDAGFGAVAVLAAIEARRRTSDVAIEPWITADGVGVVAHAPFRDERETAAQLASRVADAAARTLVATTPSADALGAARAAVLDHLERTTGPQGAAFGALAPALAPDHPSWVEPFGLFRRVAEAPVEGVRARAQALAFGPLRLAVIANADNAQATAVANAIDRWLSPAPGPRVCHAGAASAARAGHLDARLPDGAPLAQGLIGAAFPAATAVPYPYREYADLTVAALDGPGGLLAAALSGAAATASARAAGGGRAPALVVDVRAPEGSLASAVSDVKALLLRLPSTATEGDLVRAATTLERREQDARADPRRRLADLWSGRRAGPTARPSLAAWRTFLAATLREPTLVVVEARP